MLILAHQKTSVEIDAGFQSTLQSNQIRKSERSSQKIVQQNQNSGLCKRQHLHSWEFSAQAMKRLQEKSSLHKFYHFLFSLATKIS